MEYISIELMRLMTVEELNQIKFVASQNSANATYVLALRRDEQQIREFES